jgi:hypothetical protein
LELINGGSIEPNVNGMDDELVKHIQFHEIVVDAFVMGAKNGGGSVV